jgi:hypothetical protein
LHFAAGPQVRWLYASDEHAGLRKRGASNNASGPRPEGLTDLRDALFYVIYLQIHGPEIRQQNAKLFLRGP